MKIAVLLARLLFGGLFLFFGLNHFLGLVDLGGPTSQPAVDFMTALQNTDYFFPLLKWTELICGALIAIGILVPLALVVIAPVVVHILAFHLFIDGEGLVLGLALVALGAFLAFAYRKSYLPLFNPFAHPAVGKRVES